jgi:hypothetical protein
VERKSNFAVETGLPPSPQARQLTSQPEISAARAQEINGGFTDCYKT